jgi:transitional endoplasmic reticulum ATPase
MAAPAWLTHLQFQSRSSIATTFLLHFNVADWAGLENRLVRDVVIQDFLGSGGRKLVAVYSRAEGITFPKPEYQTEALRLLTGELVSGNESVRLPQGMGAAFALLDRLLYTAGTGILIEHLETILPAEDLAAMDPEELRALTYIKKWAIDPRLHRINSAVVMTAGSLTEVHPHLRIASAKIEQVMIPLPDLAEREAYIAEMVRTRGLQLAMTERELANATAGLSRMMIEDIGLRAEALRQPVTIQFVRDRKEALIRAEFGDVLEIVEPRWGFESLGGLTEAKLYAARNIIGPLKTGNERRAPLGVLLTGPPGTGKSAFFYALAREAGVNAVKLNLGKILGPYVGLSEQNFEKALLGIESLAPCLVLVDEIDQLFQRGTGGDGGGGVQQRLFARLLDFMAQPHHRGKIVFVAATNRPDLIDPALKRPGRFDRKIPFLPPGWAERVSILSALQGRYGIPGTVDWSEAARATEGYTGAEMESLLLKAWELAEESGSGELTQEAVAGALARIRPSTAAVAFMTDLAILETDDVDVLPPEYRDQAADRERLQARVDRWRHLHR